MDSTKSYKRIKSHKTYGSSEDGPHLERYKVHFTGFFRMDLHTWAPPCRACQFDNTQSVMAGYLCRSCGGVYVSAAFPTDRHVPELSSQCRHFCMFFNFWLISRLLRLNTGREYSHRLRFVSWIHGRCRKSQERLWKIWCVEIYTIKFLGTSLYERCCKYSIWVYFTLDYD